MSDSQTVSAECLWSCSEELGKEFWQQWQQYRDCLHRCCIKWMGGNLTDAEDALSRAMLKAWEKVQQYAGKIANYKSWLTRLTHNLCVDIYRERSRGANRVEDIEGYARSEEQGLVSFENKPDCAMETGEKIMVIRRAIDNLPTRLRETFILHFYQELSYPEIAQQQEISYQNVCKRISQARKILREELRGYFIGEDGTDTDKSVPPTAMEPAIGDISGGNAPVEPIAGETVTLSVAVEEVESVIKKSEFISGNRPKYNSKFSSLVLRGKIVVLITGDAAIQATGMTQEHARAFQEIADTFTCIIMSRSVNLDCTGLIEEGYASKGFKVKAKSCNWGPTAGFVLADPRLTKRGPLAESDEKKEIIKAFQDGKAGTKNVLISDVRLQYLLEHKKLYSNSNFSILNTKLADLISKSRFDCYGIVKYFENSTEKAFALQFRFKRENIKLKSGNIKPMWAIYYAPDAEGIVWDKGEYKKIKSTEKNLIPVLAMTNPTEVESHQGEKNLEDYQRALTGDYDLFAVLPVNGDKLTDSEKASLKDKCIFYDKNGWDLRHVKVGITKDNAQLLKNEHKDLGNITVRLKILMDALNSKMQEYDKYKGRNMVHHSDEAGRPFEPELEFPVIAFVPATLKNYFDLKKVVPNADAKCDRSKNTSPKGYRLRFECVINGRL
jgi:RNA polymerase sigma-70 factor (ECF subfamily)